jgi:TrmH family RNA methyltransferase
MLITSVDNKKIKKYVSLKTSKGRKEEKLFLVEGMHMCYEANKLGLLTDLIVLENTDISFSYPGEITYVTSNVLKKVSNLTNPTNVIGVVRILDNNEIVGNHILVLDDVQDPGNIGTIIRSSKAFNIDTIILSNNSCDIYNDKVLRSTQGMIFTMNIVYGDLFEIIARLRDNGYMILGTNVNDGIDVRNIKVNKFALVMGNEGNGVSEEIQSLCDKNLYIKMNNDCESLNVGVATSILLYELDRGNYE